MNQTRLGTGVQRIFDFLLECCFCEVSVESREPGIAPSGGLQIVCDVYGQFIVVISAGLPLSTGEFLLESPAASPAGVHSTF